MGLVALAVALVTFMTSLSNGVSGSITVGLCDAAMTFDRHAVHISVSRKCMSGGGLTIYGG